MNRNKKITAGVAPLAAGHVRKAPHLQITFDYNGQTYTAFGEIAQRVHKRFKTLQVLSSYSTEAQKDFSGRFGDEFRAALKCLVEDETIFYTTESKEWDCNVYHWSLKKDHH